MPGCQRPILWLPQKRQLCARRFLSRTTLIKVANDFSDSSPDPTPSQLLRFSLTGRTQQVENASQSDLDKRLEAHLVSRPLNGPHLRHLGPSRPQDEKAAYAELKHVSNLQELQLFIERNVVDSGDQRLLSRSALKQALVNCQRYHSSREILSALNALISRLEKFQHRVSPYLHVEGMRYAAQCFSTPALEHHINSFQRIASVPLKVEDLVDIAKTLLFSLRTIFFADPKYDPSLMLGLIAGEGPHAGVFPHKFRDISRFELGAYSTYVKLLKEMRATKSLKAAWKSLSQQLTPDCCGEMLDDAYDCVLTFMDAGMTEFAMDCLKDLSSKVGDSPPSIPILSRLASALAEHELQAPSTVFAGQKGVQVLDDQLRHIERRLGIIWQEKSSRHSSINNPLLTATDRPLLSIDSETVGFESVQRLVAEINALGGSHSRSDLGVIADLLNEHHGSEIPLFTQRLKDESWEFAWFPQCSPIEFSNNLTPPGSDMSVPWSPAALGLLRARLDNRGLPVSLERSRHLMQLGYLAKRPTNAAEDWRDTGYLVAFDRVRSDFVLVFIGKGSGIINPGLQYSSLEPCPRLGSISTLAMPGNPRNFKPRLEKTVFPSKEAGARYHFDVDPGMDLIP
ncbi:hypothetical protein VTN77DRAFT_3375 [Rasamsonia byssochlamydoides]|uniref:uncharacterized protein n=1 Tax=Rasamsonia byssochlamydoides TaxID=89139 RepID=UPI0037449253